MNEWMDEEADEEEEEEEEECRTKWQRWRHERDKTTWTHFTLVHYEQ